MLPRLLLVLLPPFILAFLENEAQCLADTELLGIKPTPSSFCLSCEQQCDCVLASDIQVLLDSIKENILKGLCVCALCLLKRT